MQGFTNKGSLERALLVASLALGAVHAWVARYSMNPDGISYLDVGDALVRGDWARAVNAYWSPLYGWILGLVVGQVDLPPRWQFPLVHAVNFVVFLFALLCFRFFLREVMRFCHERGSSAGEPVGRQAMPDWALLILGYAIFLWCSLDLVSVYDVSPDQLVLGLAGLTAGVLLRLRRSVTLLNFALLGFLLGLGYLTKAVLFPLGFASLAMVYLWKHSSRGWRRGIAVTGLVFFCTAAPLVLSLSAQKGRLTFGDSGRLAYAWLVSPRVFWRNWQGEVPASGTPAHPTRMLLQHPPLFEFAGPVRGTYPPWADPSYWNEGLRWHFDLHSQTEVLVGNLATELHILLRAQPGLVAAVIVLALLSGPLWREGLCELWPLVAIPAVGFMIYLPVLVETRYLGGFVLVLFLTLLAAVQLRPADQKSAGYLVIAAAITMALGTADLTVRYVTHHLAIPGSGPNSTLQDVVSAEQLQKMGSRPGDKVAVIGDGTGAYWARLAKLQIVAEIMAANHGSQEYWESSPETKESVYAAFRSAGAVLVMSTCPPAQPEPWQRIAGTSYCVFQLHTPAP